MQIEYNRFTIELRYWELRSHIQTPFVSGHEQYLCTKLLLLLLLFNLK